VSLDTSKPIHYLITAGDATNRNFETTGREICEKVRRAVDAGIELVQVREKNLSGRLLYTLTREAAAMTRLSRTRLLVNDRIDVAVAAGADGVHLTGTSLPVEAVRSVVPDEFLIGVSTHSVADVEAARDGGADFVVYGPVFDTPGKEGPKGLEDLATVCRLFGTFPVIALGGVNAGNFGQVLAAGAAGGAAIRWFNDITERRKPAL
jgi:thiamine-phosphate pyrophosphorylase